jgi:hypothetical protein
VTLKTKIEIFKYMNSIRAKMFGTTVVRKLNQGFSRSLGVLSCGGPFWVPFWPNKKVQKHLRSFV